VLATTDDPCDDLAAHAVLAADPSFPGRVVPTFRPDRYLEAVRPEWPADVARLGEVAGVDSSSYRGWVAAMEQRRAHFVATGATSADHSHEDVGTEPLEPGAAEQTYARALAGAASAAECTALRRHMLLEMARMSVEDGRGMTLHPGVRRNHHRPTLAAFGPDTGHDIPLRVEFTDALRPLLERFGTHPGLHLVLFTLDETVFSRELAPLAGFYPSVHVGAPWWFLDAPAAVRRFRGAVTETAGFTRTSGFIDDTRAFCSIPARHDMSRRRRRRLPGGAAGALRQPAHPARAGPDRHRRIAEAAGAVRPGAPPRTGRRTDAAGRGDGARRLGGTPARRRHRGARRPGGRARRAGPGPAVRGGPPRAGLARRRPRGRRRARPGRPIGRAGPLTATRCAPAASLHCLQERCDHDRVTSGLRERKKAATRLALHEAALRLVAERGLDRVSVDDIAESADVSPRTFFNYFPTKDDAVIGLDPLHAAQLTEALAARPADETPVQALRAVLAEQAAEMAAEPQVWPLRLQVIDASPALAARLSASFAETERLLAGAIAARTGTAVDTDVYPTLLAAVQAAVMRTALHRWLASGFTADLPALTGEAWDVLAAGLPSPSR